MAAARRSLMSRTSPRTPTGAPASSVKIVDVISIGTRLPSRVMRTDSSAVLIAPTLSRRAN